MPSLGSGLSLGTLNSLPGYDFDVSAFIQQTGVSPTATIKDFTGVTAPNCLGARLQGTATGLTLSATENWTLAGWFNNTTLVTGPNFLFGFGNSFKLYLLPSGANTFMQFEYGSTNIGPYTFTTPAGTWFHVAVTSFRSGGGAQSHKIYFNGSLVSTLTTSVSQTLSSPTFYIGGGGSSEYALGVIADEVSFFKRELSSLEISFLYASGDGLSYSEASSAISMNNIYSWYSLSETTGNRLNSVNSSVCPLSSNGSGTIVNARGWVAPKVSVNPRKQLNDFVLGVKGLGLWNNIIFWPMRSYQNIGTGTIVYSLGGIGSFNGTFANSPAWRTEGVLFNGVNSQVNISSSVISNNTGTLFYSGSHSLLSGTSQKGMNFGNIELGKAEGTSFGVEATHLKPSYPTAGRGVVIAGFNSGFFYTATGVFSTSTTTMSRFYNAGTKENNTSASYGSFETPPENIATIGGRTTSTNSPFNGLISIATYLNTALSDANVSSLNTLYKTTLGTGLGLP